MLTLVYGYNENEMTVDNAEVNLLKVKLNQSCGKDVITYYKSDALNIANSVDSTRSKCDPNIEGLLLLSIIMLNIKI